MCVYLFIAKWGVVHRVPEWDRHAMGSIEWVVEEGR